MATPTVEVLISSTWTAVDADQVEIVKRFGPDGYATFRIPDASVQDRLDCRMHRRVRISVTDGEDTSWFLGSIASPRVVTDHPGGFRLEVECAALAEEARYKVPHITDLSTLEYPDKIEAISITSMSPSKDAEVKEDDPTANFGSATSMRVDRTINDARFVYMEFDLASNIPETDRVSLARLFLRTVGSDGLLTAPFRPVLVEESWAENTITWNNRPDIEASDDQPEGFEVAARDMQVDDVGHFVIFDITGHVRRQRGAEATVSNNGIRITESTGAGAQPFKDYATKEAVEADRPFLAVTHHAPVRITDVVEDVWGELFSEVDTTEIEHLDGWYIPFGTVYDSQTNLYEMTDDLAAMLPNYHWWLDTTDGDDIVLRFEQVGPNGPTLISSDIGFNFEMRPTNPRIRNHIIVVGAVGGGVDEDGVEQESRLLTTAAVDSDSITAFGRQVGIEYVAVATIDELRLRALSLVAREAWEYWRLTLTVDDFSIRPGHAMIVSIAAVGMDNNDFATTFIAAETKDSLVNGVLTRTVTLVENRS